MKDAYQHTIFHLIKIGIGILRRTCINDLPAPRGLRGGLDISCKARELGLLALLCQLFP
jgi:hypothetical protein